MDPYYYEFNQELVVSNPNVESMPSKASKRDQITLNFTCKHKHNHWIRSTEDSTELQLLEDRESPVGTKSMQYCVPRIDKRRKFILRAAVFKGLEDFPLSFLERQDLSQFALNTAWEILVETSQNHHHHHHLLRLDFDVTLVHDLAIDESRYVEWMSQEAATEDAMVPATEASIESLLSKTIECSKENHGSCAVCLEDFENGSGCVATTMPCSHIFHGECIEKWLRRSHHCPICRYEMPVECSE